MRIPSGSTDRRIAFVALDSAGDRVTGLSSFTVYRSRNGGTPAALTTPTVTELDATNMPGVYALLVDEDTTLTAGRDTEELALHIAAAGMLDVTRTVELYRPETTEGQTLAVSGGTGNAQVKGLDAGVVTAAAIATDAIGSAQIAAGGATKVATSVWSTLTSSITTPTSIGLLLKNNVDATISSRSSHAAADVWAVGTRELTSGANIVLAKGVGITGLNDLDAAGVRSAVGLAAANLDTQLGAIDTVADAIRAVTDNLPDSGSLTTIAGNVAAILDDTGTSGVVVASASKSGYSLAASGLDLVVMSEPAGAVSLTGSVVEGLGWLVALNRNKVTQDATTLTLRNAADNADIATATVSDDGTTATRGAYS